MRNGIGGFFCAFATRNEREMETETNGAAGVATITTVAETNPTTKVLVQKLKCCCMELDCAKVGWWALIY